MKLCLSHSNSRVTSAPAEGNLSAEAPVVNSKQGYQKAVRNKY